MQWELRGDRPIYQQLVEKLTEQIALMNTRTFGKKSEKLQIDEDQLSFFSEI